MKSNWLYDQSALGTVAVLLAVMLLAFELAYQIARRWHTATEHAGREVFVAVKVSLLGMLALLLAFTFGMAVDRYAERQRLVTAEANLLHGMLLQSTLLPEGARAQFRQLFGQFVDARLAFFDARRNLVAVEQAINLTEELHRQMWELVRTEMLRYLPMNGAEGMVRSLNEEWTIHRQRVHAFENRVPDAVVMLLFGGAVIAMAALGFAAGIANHRGTTGKLLLAALLAGTILVVLDLDRPRRGIFQISQEPMVHLKQLFEHEAETKR
jgi:hypothetical protein